MSLSSFSYRLTIWVFAGAAAGLMVGLLLVALDVVENPYWFASAGIGVAAVAVPLRERSRPGLTPRDET